MSTPVNFFQYEIEDRLGPLIVAPLRESDFVIEWERTEDGQLDYNQNLPSGILFRGQAFNKLLFIEQSIYRCEYCMLKVSRKCGGAWVPIFTGRMSNNDAAWDLDKCEVVMKVSNTGPDQCIKDSKSIKKNIFDAVIDPTLRRTVLLSPANVVLETIDFSSTVTGEAACATQTPWMGTGTADDGKWIEYKEERITTGSGPGKTCTLNASFAREKIVLSCGLLPPGPEWVPVADTCPGGTTTWARNARLYGCAYQVPDYSAGTQIASYECFVIGEASQAIEIDNGLPLKDVIEYFLSVFCGTLNFVSDFFQINPENPSTINYVTGQRTKTAYITIFQKSDVKRPGVTGNATIENMTLENLLSGLVAMFNVRWRIVGDTMRMEHISFFQKNQGLNLTLSKYARAVSGKRKYTYDAQEIPKKETFSFMEAGNGDFAGEPITYGFCVTVGSDTEKKYSAENITTDVQLALSNPDSDSTVVDDDGFVFIAADYDSVADKYYIISENPIFGGNIINNSLAWAQLQRDYYRHDRPLRTGRMNLIETTFFSVKPTKRGEKITIPLCCNDTFNPDDIITTPLGAGIVDKASFSFKNETLTLDLLYEANANLNSNNPPVANNDVANTRQDTAVLIDVLANDTDDNNNITRIEILLTPLHGTAVVVGNKVLYTPNAGYVGNDVFTYRIFDEWNQPSDAGALVSVNVTATNTAPVAVNDNYTTQKNTSLVTVSIFGLFINDSDDAGFSLDAYDATSANGGTVVVNPDGSFTYTPATGFVGTDTFSYRIIDADLATDTATVTIIVREPNAPVANTDNYQTVKNTNLTVAAPGVLANDTTTVGALVATAATITTAQGGSATLAANGSFTYVPPVNYVGMDSFTYTADNGTETDNGTVNIMVLPPVYARLTVENIQTINQFITCDNGNTDGGVIKKETVKVSFYEDAAGFIPMDVTAYTLKINIDRATQTSPGGLVNHVTDEFFVTGTQYIAYLDRTFFRNIKNCDGVTIFYLSEVFTLLPGGYTII